MFSGTIRHGGFWYGGDDKSKIPYIPEFDDPSYRSVYLTRRLEGVNALSLFEGNLDYSHVSRVHMVSFIESLAPDVVLKKKTNSQKHIYETDKIIIDIENTFWLPFSNCLKFHVTNKRNGNKLSPFLLFFSLLPHDDHTTTVNIRFMRKTIETGIKQFTQTFGVENTIQKIVNNDILFVSERLTDIIEKIIDIVCIGVVDLPLMEDADVVRHVDTKRLLADNLAEEDSLIQHWRNKMFRESPKTMEYFLS